MLKVREGQKLTGKEKRAFAKAEKEGRLPRVDADADTEPDAGTKKAHPALSIPESWARALEAVTVHARGGTNDGGGADDDGKNKNASDAVVDVAGLDVSIRGATLLEEADLRVPRGAKVALLGANGSGKSTLVRLVASGRIKAATRRRLAPRRSSTRPTESPPSRASARATPSPRVTARRVRDHTKNGRRVVR